MVHRALVERFDDNTMYGLGAAGRLKFSPRVSLLADYAWIRRSPASRAYYQTRGLRFYNPLGVGLEVETGGHVFALTFTNSAALLENQFLPETRATWTKGQFRWGFTISRRFTLKKNTG